MSQKFSFDFGVVQVIFADKVKIQYRERNNSKQPRQSQDDELDVP